MSILEQLQSFWSQRGHVLSDPILWWQCAVILLAGLSAWTLYRSLTKTTEQLAETDGRGRLRRLTLKSIKRILFPAFMLLGVLIGRIILHGLHYDTALLDIAVPLLLSLAAIRCAVYLLRKGFTPGPLVKAWENLISTTVWGLVALHLLGWLPDFINTLDSLAFSLGDMRISMLLLIKLVMTVVIFWVLALWLIRILESQIAHSQHMSPGVQVGIKKFAKFVLLTAAVLIALEAVGIDLTALKVFGGALGVGLGFGLQRIASNFISGFIVLFDRSIRPGDVITVGDRFGWVQELRARYIVVRDRDGVETLIPNETLVTSEVINWSYSDTDIRIKLPVQISYTDDPEQAMNLMLQCASASARIKTDPEPVCRLTEFGDNGIHLELRVWIIDPENGLASVRSDIFLAIWRAFKEAGITIPYPQRDIHIIKDPVAIATD